MWSSRPNRCSRRFPIWVGVESDAGAPCPVRYAHGLVSGRHQTQHREHGLDLKQGWNASWFCKRGGRDPKGRFTRPSGSSGPAASTREHRGRGRTGHWRRLRRVGDRRRLQDLGVTRRCRLFGYGEAQTLQGPRSTTGSLFRDGCCRTRLKPGVFSRMWSGDLPAGRGNIHDPGWRVW